MEDSCQTVNGTGPDISCSRKRRSFSSDSNDSLTSKKSKTTDWRGKKRAESEELEKKIIPVVAYDEKVNHSLQVFTF